MDNYTNPSVADFQNYFVRDFNYGTDPSTVMSNDITNALAQAGAQINPQIFFSQSNYTIGYLQLAAHFLVTNLRASSQGIAGQYNFLQSGKGVGPAHEEFAIPDRILENPDFAMLVKTNYGAMYLQSVLPLLNGQMFTVWGFTKP